VDSKVDEKYNEDKIPYRIFIEPSLYVR